MSVAGKQFPQHLKMSAIINLSHHQTVTELKSHFLSSPPFDYHVGTGMWV